MNYFCSTDLEWLTELNSRGTIPGNVTQRWVDVIQHPDRNEWAACIPDSYLPRLGEVLGSDAAEVASNLKTADQMLAEGWEV